MDGKKGVNEVLTAKATQKPANNGKKHWNKPSLEDVSQRVMAQPYIRFT